MRKVLTLGVSVALTAMVWPAIAQDQGGTNPPGTNPPAANPPADNSTGTNPPAGGTGGGITQEQYQALQQKVNDLQKQLDEIKTANGGQTPLEAAQAFQKQLDDIKAALARAATPGYGKLTFGGLAQVWVGLSNHPDPPPIGHPPVADPGTRPFQGYFRTQGFGARLRRMEVNVNDQIDPKFSVHTMADFTRASSTHSGENGAPNEIGILQDLYLQYDFSKADSLYVGQLKIPLSEVGLHSSAHLPTIERPLFVVGQRNFVTVPRGVTNFNVPLWGDIRETGIQYRRTVPVYTFMAAITQGAGDYQNATQLDYGKQFTGQIFWRPTKSPNLQFGVTGSAGSGFQARAAQATAAAGQPTPPPPGLTYLSRLRAGASVIYSPGRWYFESEYMTGNDGVGIFQIRPLAITAVRHGEYGLLGYDLGGYRGGDGNQLVGQVDFWDPGIGLPRQTNYTLGINHDMDKGHRRLQINYVHQHYEGGSPAPDQPDNDQIVAALAANF